MTKSYYDDWTSGQKLIKLSKALLLLKDAPVAQVIDFMGVPRKVLERAARDSGNENYLDDTHKPALLPRDFYDAVEVDDLDDSLDPATRLTDAINAIQNACSHSKFFCRCSKCMKVLGSEVNHYSMETIFKLIKEVQADLQDPNDERYNDGLREMGAMLFDNLYKETITSLEHEAITTEA